MPELQTVMPPPKPPKNPTLATGFPDDIRELGDSIANLSVREAKELSLYLETEHKIGSKPS